MAKWKRLIPLFDVIGAVLIFGSWIASNALSQRAQGQASAHQDIADRVRQYRLYEDFALRLTDVQSDLNRIGHAVETPGGASGSATPGWSGMTSAEVRELNDFVDSLLQYATEVSPSDEVRAKLESVQQQAREITEEFHAARDEYDRILDERQAATDGGPGETTSGKELQQQVDGLWGRVRVRQERNALLRRPVARTCRGGIDGSRACS